MSAAASNALVLDSLVVKFLGDASHLLSTVNQVQSAVQTTTAQINQTATQQAAATANSTSAIQAAQDTTRRMARQASFELFKLQDAAARAPASVRPQVDALVSSAAIAAQSVTDAAADAMRATTSQAARDARIAARNGIEQMQYFKYRVAQTIQEVDHLNSRVLALAHSQMILGFQMAAVGRSFFMGTTVPITAIALLLTKTASDAVESKNKFAEVFRGVSEEAEKAAQMLDDSYGMSSTGAKRLLADTGDLLNGFGFTKQASLELSTEVQKLAADLTSFSNFQGGVERASTAITRALLGEREMLKSLGKTVLETDVKQRIALLTAQGVTFATERQAKAYATLQLIQEQSKNAIGDYARTQEDFAQKLRDTQGDIQDMAELYGEQLLPYASKFIEYTREMVLWLENLDTSTKRWVIAGAVGVAALGAGVLTLTAAVGTAVHMWGMSTLVLTHLGIEAAAVAATLSTAGAAAAVFTGKLLLVGAVAYGAFKVGEAIREWIPYLGGAATEWENAKQKADALTESVQKLQKVRRERVLSDASGLFGDAKIDFLKEQLALAKNDMLGLTNQAEVMNERVDDMNTTWNYFTGNKMLAETAAEATAVSLNLAEAKKYVLDLEKALSDAENNDAAYLAAAEKRSELAKLEAELRKEIATLSGGDKASQLYDLTEEHKASAKELEVIRQLVAEKEKLEQQQSVRENVLQWENQLQVIMMSSREIETYRAKQLGMSADFIADMQKLDAELTRMEANKALSDAIQDWEKQAATIGMTTRQARIYEAQLAGADDQVLKIAESWDKVLTQQERAQSIRDLNDKLEEQIATFGMSSEQASVYRLQLEGATDAELKHTRALVAGLEARRQYKKDQDEAKEIIKSLRTPMEVFNDTQVRMTSLLRQGLLTQKQYNAAIKEAREQIFGAGGMAGKHDVVLRFITQGLDDVQKNFLLMQRIKENDTEITVSPIQEQKPPTTAPAKPVAQDPKLRNPLRRDQNSTAFNDDSGSATNGVLSDIADSTRRLAENTLYPATPPQQIIVEQVEFA